MEMCAHIIEPMRKLAVSGSFDVIVCGGGPAGCAAAVRSAREGCRTLLIEKSEALGGIWSSGLMPWILDHQNKTGIIAEIKEKLLLRGGYFPRPNTFTAPPEEVRFLLEELCLQSGVTLLYDTMVTAAVSAEDLIQAIVTESPSGREAWSAKCFIDCTGNGDLAARAGCRFEYGNVQGLAQPASLNALIGGVSLDSADEFLGIHPGGKEKLFDVLKQAGIPPSYGKPSLFHFGCGILGLMSHHAYGCCGFDARSLTGAVTGGRRELHRQMEVLRTLPGWNHAVLLGTASQLGIREGRRIFGRDRVTVEELCPDAPEKRGICVSKFAIDIHSLDPAQGNSYSTGGYCNKENGFGIPMESLIAADFNNLLMAGRCISGDSIMHASYRVTGDAVPLGEAAGCCAARSVRQNCFPWEVKEIPCFSE